MFVDFMASPFVFLLLIFTSLGKSLILILAIVPALFFCVPNVKAHLLVLAKQQESITIIDWPDKGGDFHRGYLQ